jgi:hypothetical protein
LELWVQLQALYLACSYLVVHQHKISLIKLGKRLIKVQLRLLVNWIKASNYCKILCWISLRPSKLISKVWITRTFSEVYNKRWHSWANWIRKCRTITKVLGLMKCTLVEVRWLLVTLHLWKSLTLLMKFCKQFQMTLESKSVLQYKHMDSIICDFWQHQCLHSWKSTWCICYNNNSHKVYLGIVYYFQQMKLQE